MCESLSLYVKTERLNESEGARSSRAQGGWSVGLHGSISRTPEASRFQSVNAGAL